MKHEKFIREYCRIIDQCHGQRPDSLWFSTWMSSKSPYFNFPQNFEKYWLNGHLPPKITLSKKMKLALRQIVTFGSVLVKSLYLKIKLRQELRELYLLEGQEINLVRTFLYKTDREAKDPFWGDLIDLLTGAQRPLVTIYDPNFSILHCKNIYDSKKHNFPYLVFLSPLSLIKIYFSLLQEAFKKISFRGDFLVNEKNIGQFVTDFYQAELLSPASLINLVFMNAFQTIFKKFQVHKAYLTFENNPWEKMFYLARAATNKKVEVIGFQHSSIQEGATNYLLSAYESQNHLCPDKIISVGEYTYQLMKDSPHYKNIPIEIGCALRHLYLEKINEHAPISKGNQINLLIVLDGTLDTVKLIQLVLEFLKLNQSENLSIMIKEHPNLLLKNFFPEFFSNEYVLSKKIIISTEGLQKNLEWADIILYSGTTSSIEALKMGKAVINYNFSMFNYDPLFQFKDFKWEANTPQDLSDIIDNYLKLSPSDLQERKLAAKKFVNSYFSPCTRENIERFL